VSHARRSRTPALTRRCRGSIVAFVTNSSH
jgi:hypothetical protein